MDSNSPTTRRLRNTVLGAAAAAVLGALGGTAAAAAPTIDPDSIGNFAPASDRSPRFSPDGTQLVFTRALPDGSSRVIVVQTAGGSSRDILPGVNAFDPVWSADGDRITFTWRDGGTDTPTFSLGIVRSDGVLLRRITTAVPHSESCSLPGYSASGEVVRYPLFDPSDCHADFAASLPVPTTLGTGHLRTAL